MLAHTPHIEAEAFATAIAEGDRFLAAAPSTPPLDDYHRAILAALEVDATPALLAALVRPLALAGFIEVFPDVLPALEALRARAVRMAVISDSWPNLPDLHAGLGPGGFFEAYALSAVLGATKPDPRIYRHASDALGLPPEACLYVDDAPALVAAAMDLGYDGRVLKRDGDDRDPGALPLIATLEALLPLFPPA